MFDFVAAEHADNARQEALWTGSKIAIELHEAIQAKDAGRLSAAYAQSAQLHAGMTQEQIEARRLFGEPAARGCRCLDKPAPGKGGASVMTEERARYYAEALARSMGVTFYVVRSREGRFLAVQVPSDDCQIRAEFTPPRGARLLSLLA
jgi:hypothetical protein